MSGIYIAGMEMPAEGFVDVRIKCNGTAAHSTGEPPYFRVYEAVPVPDHGRLIDADAFVPSDGYLFSDGRLYVSTKSVNEAPTIIPADKERNG